jgi:hypothetical protein
MPLKDRKIAHQGIEPCSSAVLAPTTGATRVYPATAAHASEKARAYM